MKTIYLFIVSALVASTTISSWSDRRYFKPAFQ
jgi:hypothetical protein